MANNVAEQTGVGQDKVAGDAALVRLLEGLLDDLLGLLDVLRGAVQDPGDLALRIGSSVLVVRDEGQGAVGGGCRSGKARGNSVASVVDGHLVLVPQPAEELAVVGDDVVDAAGHLDGRRVLLLDERLDVLLGLLDIGRLAGDLDLGAGVALARDVDDDVELGLDLASRLAAAANQGAVLVLGNIDDVGNLAGALADKVVDLLHKLLDKLAAALDLDGRVGAVLVGKLDGTRKISAVIRAARLDNKLADVGAARADQGLVELLVDLNGLDNRVVELGLLLLQNLLGSSDLLFGTLELDLDDRVGVAAAVGNVNLGTSLLAKRVQLHELLTRLVSTLLGATDHDLVWSLLAARLAGIACGRVVIARSLGGVGEENEDVVSCLEAVDGGALDTNELTVELGLNLDAEGSLVGKLATEGHDVSLGLLGLGLGALELDLAVRDLDLDVKLVAKLTDVAAALANEVVGVSLGEIKGEGEAALLVVLDLLLNESADLGNELVNRRLGARDLHVGARARDTDLGPVGGVGGHIKARGLEDLLGSKEVGDVLVSVANALLVDGDLLGRGHSLRNGVGCAGILRLALVDEQQRGTDIQFVVLVGDDQVDAVLLLDTGEDIVPQVLVVEGVDWHGRHAAWGVAGDNVLDLSLGTEGVLAVAGVQLPGERTLAGERGVDETLVLGLQTLDFFPLAQVAGDVASVGSSAAWGLAMEARDIIIRALHAVGQLAHEVEAVCNLVGRANDGHCVVLGVLGQHNDTASLVEELLQGDTVATDDELVAARGDGCLVQLKLLVKLGGQLLNLGASILNSNTLTREVDMVIVGNSGEHRAATGSAGCRGLGRLWACGGHADLDTAALEVCQDAASRVGNEGVELGGDVAQVGADAGRALIGDLEDGILSGTGGQGITLDRDINSGIVVVDGRHIFSLGELDAGAGLFLERLDGRALLADDVGSHRLGDGDVDSNLGTNLLNKVTQGLLGNLGRAGSIELPPATAGLQHGDVCARLAVEVLDDVRDRALERGTGQDLVLLEGDTRNTTVGDVDGRRAGGARSGSGSTVGSGAVGGRAIGRRVSLDAPDGDSGSSLLGSAKLGEELVGLGVDLGDRGSSSSRGRGGVFLLAGGLGRRGGSPRSSGRVGRGRTRRGGSSLLGSNHRIVLEILLVGDRFHNHMVAAVLLEEPLSRRGFIAGGGSRWGTGGHCFVNQTQSRIPEG
ncbi:hypothetical protein F503_08293 [Ophiostoma piceae UAMH 11346]|uniref:Uncharacterized protein n=1 Tax=Ophiostoma piceae (strain UAMH 11346) TaxID=1262450 RepID=S3BZ21_OPHP1|nr:hypothetical protein F503_08293 [Ophiostoma piceae UAMH 11346]